ncbi:hypothetical protein ANCCEY_13002 [Ancylostoma ceylanicum]|uniref:Inhibitor of growth protein N-terminal histone-binding domain-containing protein n=1 Tax=Ancylostoma ceylanicum TaxID=53326 RepID=A0A0D6L8H4_9BILA|nr:hypothetical protein ANCCEY_13002 [Ancylostoma ceylanicum]
MQYLEDIIELVEDLPEEICKRFEQIRKWDNDVERLRLECKYAAKRIMEVTETSQPMREKILMELADKYRLIHRLSERKLDLAIRSQRLMSAVLDKVNDSSYLCKIELEVDNPGCTEAIERRKPHKDKLERSDSPRSVTSEGSHSGYPSGNKLKKRKYISDGPPAMSNYMRKKQERERERSKLARVHAARQEENQRRQQKLALTSHELADVADFSTHHITDDFFVHDVVWNQQLFQAFSQSPAMPGLVLDSLPSSPSPSASVSSWDRKKRTSISFGNVSETTSIHGRPRKMTERAVELLQNNKDREERKRKVEVVDGEANERWCFCREVSSGSMICCDAPDVSKNCPLSLNEFHEFYFSVLHTIFLQMF